MSNYARNAIEKYSPSIRERFEGALKDEFSLAYSAIDSALVAEMHVDSKLDSCDERRRKQIAFVLAAFRKSINDLLGCVEILRAGYFDLAQGALRSSLEGFSVAILIHTDINIYKKYIAGEYSVNNAVHKFVNNKKLIAKIHGAQFLRVYKRLHKMAHPTIVAISLQSEPDGPGFPIGGAFYPKRVSRYKAVVEEVRTMALNSEGYIREHISL